MRYAAVVEIGSGQQPVGMKCNHGLCLDTLRHLAFIASEDVDSLVVFDLESGRVVDRFPVGGGPDVLAFDQGARQLYVACESGTISVFRVNEAGVVKRGEQAVGFNSHVVAVDRRRTSSTYRSKT